MSNPFLNTRENISPVDPNFTTFSMFLAAIADRHDLEEVHTDWIKRNAMLHVPRLILTLWEAFPEWPVTDKLLHEERFGVRIKLADVSYGEREKILDDHVRVHPEFLCIEVRGKIVAAY